MYKITFVFFVMNPQIDFESILWRIVCRWHTNTALLHIATARLIRYNLLCVLQCMTILRRIVCSWHANKTLQHTATNSWIHYNVLSVLQCHAILWRKCTGSVRISPTIIYCVNVEPKNWIRGNWGIFVASLMYRERNDTLQHTTTSCNTLQQWHHIEHTAQHWAIHCNTLQRTATHCNTLQ